jgi:hypothetical protein
MEREGRTWIVAVLVSALGSLSVAQQTVRVSVDSSGNQSNDVSYSPELSADGQFVVFESNADNLVVGDTNGFPDIFVHDRLSGTTKLLSVASSRLQSNEQSYYARSGATVNCRIHESRRTRARRHERYFGRLPPLPAPLRSGSRHVDSESGRRRAPCPPFL